jgi:predicted Fe-Mo cluster-binding NifX family protein
MQGVIKMPYNIALTSSNGKQVDTHFGHADDFYILQVDEESGAWEILEKKALPASSASATGDDCNDGCGEKRHEKMMSRIETVKNILEGCTYLLTAKIGPKPCDLLRHSGITALESPPDIGEAILKLNKYHLKYGNINKEN